MQSGGFLKGAGVFVNCIWLGLLWLLCSLPILSVGAASAALYYAVVKGVRHDYGAPARLFFAALRDNFKTATLSWLVLAAFAALVACDLWLIRSAGFAGSWLELLSWLLLIPLLLVGSWLFAYISRFSNTVLGGFRFLLFFAVQHLGRSAALAALLIGTVALVGLLPQLVPVLPGLHCLLASYIIEPAFRPLTEQLGEADAWYNE